MAVTAEYGCCLNTLTALLDGKRYEMIVLINTNEPVCWFMQQ